MCNFISVLKKSVSKDNSRSSSVGMLVKIYMLSFVGIETKTMGVSKINEEQIFLVQKDME